VRARFSLTKSKIDYDAMPEGVMKLTTSIEEKCIILKGLKEDGYDIVADQAERDNLLELRVDIRYLSRMVLLQQLRIHVYN
jgi:hypothetical protein